MADLVIRGIPDSLQRLLRTKALSEGITLKQLVVPILEMAVNSKPLLTELHFTGTPDPARSFDPPDMPSFAEQAAATRKYGLVRPGCPECGSLSGHQKGCKGVKP